MGLWFVCFNCILICYHIMLRKYPKIFHVGFDSIGMRMLQPMADLVQILCQLNCARADSAADNKILKTLEHVIHSRIVHV